MDPVPAEVESLLSEREAARQAKDYALADALRARIDALGFEVRDAPGGATAVRKPAYARVDPKTLPTTPPGPPTKAISVHVVYEGFRDDLTRFVAAIEAHCSAHDYEIVVTDPDGTDGEWIEALAGPRLRTLHWTADPAWGASRNAALRTSEGWVVAVADLSVEAHEDLLGPAIAALADPRVGAAGPWGIATENLRDFDASGGPAVDAIEGYFLAFRRELLDRVAFDEKFRWYRHADIDLCFQIRALGLDAVVTPVKATRHTHRAWAALEQDPGERERRSKRNFNRFLERFRGRKDLLVANR